MRDFTPEERDALHEWRRLYQDEYRKNNALTEQLAEARRALEHLRELVAGGATIGMVRAALHPATPEDVPS
jgi:hypothetical protein